MLRRKVLARDAGASLCTGRSNCVTVQRDSCFEVEPNPLLTKAKLSFHTINLTAGRLVADVFGQALFNPQR